MDIEKLISKMTLNEKLSQILQLNSKYLYVDSMGEATGPEDEVQVTKDQICSVGSVLNFVGAKEMIYIQNEHLKSDPNKIPLLFMHDIIHGYKTIYPIPLALGASFDTKLAEECCEMASTEMALGGVHVTFAPMVDLARDPRWGRCMETTGEDTYLNGEMASAMVRGFQKSGETVACVKHFAAYGQAEAGRDYNTTDMSERTLRDFYLPAYKCAIDAGAELVMTSFNILNGVPSSGNEWLIKNLLRNEWKFNKIVISDYNAFREMHVHGFCEDERECARRAINATCDIEMMSSCYINEIPKLIEQGVVSESQIDEAVRRVLRLKQKLGLFENPYKFANEQKENEVCLCDKHREIARRACENSCVLLKNNSILPFNSNKLSKIAVIGPFADRVMLGSWSAHGKESDGVSVLQGVKRLCKDCEVLYAKGCGDEVNSSDLSLVWDAVKIASECDAVILCLGESSGMSGESMSRVGLRLSTAQQTLIREVVAVNSNSAVVLFNGRPLVLSDIIDEIPALMTAWQPGSEGGNAIANLLFGRSNFSAKLPMTFPRAEGQIPIYYNSYRTGRPYQGPYGSWYIDMPNEPLFPFGYGLSYTEFDISKPILSKNSMNRSEKITASVMVKNKGSVNGEVVLQMYINDRFASLVRPVKELKGFKKVMLAPNEEREVSFEISDELLKFWSANNKFESENGEFLVWISDCSDKGEAISFTLTD